MDSASKVSAASNRLGLSLLRSLSAQDGGNVFLSPFSLSAALAMLHCSARGKTRDEMSEVLGYNEAGLGNDEVHLAFSQLLSALKDAPKSYVLSVANSMVADKRFAVKDEYKALLQASFDASLVEADFATQSKKAVEDINTWVKGKTNGMIPQLLDKLGPNTVLVLLNAIYFKGTWMSKFKESSTRPQDFYNKGLKANAKKVQMMHETARFGYAERETFTVLQLLYMGDRMAMMVLLPRTIEGLKELEAQLTPELLNDLQKELRQTKVDMMHQTSKFGYAEMKNFGVLQLPYIGEGVAMLVLLPHAIDGIAELETQLTPESIGDIKNNLRRAKVNVSLPKFTLEYSAKLKEILQSLGMLDAFEYGADLAGMSDSTQLAVDEVIHKAVVKVNEEGSEAAAATAVVVKARSLGARERIVDFVADHPFLFAILDVKKDTVLFLGKLNEL